MSGNPAQEHERRMRKAARYLAERDAARAAALPDQSTPPAADGGANPDASAGDGGPAAARRSRRIPDLGPALDPDWWVKELIRREQLSGLAPAPFLLRKEDSALDELLDAQSSERGVRELVEDFNARIISARRQLLGGPPVVTPTRDVEREVERWHERRAARRRPAAVDASAHSGGRWWQRLFGPRAP